MVPCLFLMIMIGDRMDEKSQMDKIGPFPACFSSSLLHGGPLYYLGKFFSLVVSANYLDLIKIFFRRVFRKSSRLCMSEEAI